MSKNQNGLLIPIAHPVALAHSMLRVLKDPLPQRDLGENGIKTVLTFSLQDRVVAQDEELDERLVQ